MIVNSGLDSGMGTYGTRGDVMPGVNQKVSFQGPLDSGEGNQYLNPDAFDSLPDSDYMGPLPDPVCECVATRWGTAPRFLPSTRGPGFQSEDFALLKDTHLSERFVLRFRADFFNVLNRTGLGDPGTDVGDPGSFGRIYGVSHGPRNIMLSLRLDF